MSTKRPILSLIFLIPMMFNVACRNDPPTITPGPAGSQDPISGDSSQPTPPPGQVIEITMAPPPVEIPPIVLDESVLYRDADGLFSMEIPSGWPESRKDEISQDVRLGTAFQAPGSGGLLSITQFDNGERPQSLGSTVNHVLRLTGWLDQPNYREINRENVIERDGDAIRIELAYTRGSSEISMHSMVLFQIDGTTFSMVHLGVEEKSWNENVSEIRRMLSTYSVPAVQPPSE